MGTGGLCISDNLKCGDIWSIQSGKSSSNSFLASHYNINRNINRDINPFFGQIISFYPCQFPKKSHHVETYSRLQSRDER